MTGSAGSAAAADAGTQAGYTGYGMDWTGLSASRSSLMTAEFPVVASIVGHGVLYR